MKNTNIILLAAACVLATGMTAAGELLSPEIGMGWENGWVRQWKDNIPGLDVEDRTERVSDGVVKVVRRWTWTGKTPLEKVTLSVRYRMNGDPLSLKPFIPGILLYGNPSNKGRKDGRVPVFAGHKGEFAIFEDHRLPMPFAVLENAVSGDFAAVHILPSPVQGGNRPDQWWSLGVEAASGGVDIVLLSGPIGYNRMRSVSKAHMYRQEKYDNAYMTLRPGQVLEKTFWIQTGVWTKDAFGFEQAMNLSLDLFKPYDVDHHAPVGKIARLKRDYALTRWIEGPNLCGFTQRERRTGRKDVVLGWTGCGATCGYALPVLDFDKSDWEKAQKSLDFIGDRLVGTIRSSDGMFNVRCKVDGRTSGGDPVSCGQSLYCIMKAIRFAGKSGGGRLDATKWRTFASRALDAISDAVLQEDWREPASTAQGFLVAPLVLGSEIFNRPEHLAAAKKLAGFFGKRYFGIGRAYWGGSLDAKCEDKEGAYAAFQGYEALLRHAVKTKNKSEEEKYARLAQHAMNMMLTYTMVWNSTYPPGRLADHAFKSMGWTVVSPQNQHLDAFGVMTVPEIWRMGDYLNDWRLKKLASLMYRSCFQLTSQSGALGESIQHTYYDSPDDRRNVFEQRGGYREGWTVFWLTAHFLNAAAEMKEMGVEL